MGDFIKLTKTKKSLLIMELIDMGFNLTRSTMNKSCFKLTDSDKNYCSFSSNDNHVKPYGSDEFLSLVLESVK